MKRIAIIVVMTLISLTASARSIRYFTQAQATRTVQYLHAQREMVIYCGFDYEIETYVLINEVWMERVNSSYYEIWVYGYDAYTGDEIYMPLDLECVWLYSSGQMYNAAQYLRFHATVRRPAFTWYVPPYNPYTRVVHRPGYSRSYHYDIHRHGWMPPAAPSHAHGPAHQPQLPPYYNRTPQSPRPAPETTWTPGAEHPRVVTPARNSNTGSGATVNSGRNGSIGNSNTNGGTTVNSGRNGNTGNNNGGATVNSGRNGTAAPSTTPSSRNGGNNTGTSTGSGRNGSSNNNSGTTTTTPSTRNGGNSTGTSTGSGRNGGNNSGTTTTTTTRNGGNSNGSSTSTNTGSGRNGSNGGNNSGTTTTTPSTRNGGNNNGNKTSTNTGSGRNGSNLNSSNTNKITPTNTRNSGTTTTPSTRNGNATTPSTRNNNNLGTKATADKTPTRR